jgi:hypothetical protein
MRALKRDEEVADLGDAVFFLARCGLYYRSDAHRGRWESYELRQPESRH